MTPTVIGCVGLQVLSRLSVKSPQPSRNRDSSVVFSAAAFCWAVVSCAAATVPVPSTAAKASDTQSAVQKPGEPLITSASEANSFGTRDSLRCSAFSEGRDRVRRFGRGKRRSDLRNFERRRCEQLLERYAAADQALLV